MKNLNLIVTGVIVAIIVSLLKKYGNKVIEWYIKRNEKYSNRLYEEVARNLDYRIGLYNLLSTLFIASMISIPLMVDYFFQAFDLGSHSFVENPNIEEASTFIRIVANKYIFRVIVVLFLCILSLMFFLLFMKMVRLNYILSYNSTFKRYLNVIRPEITNEKYLKFKQDWALMKSREDYARIEKEIDKEYEKVLKNRKEEQTKSGDGLF